MLISIAVTNVETLEPLAGVSVAIYDEDSFFVGSGTTTSQGSTSFNLAGSVGGVLYQVRLYRSETIFGGPYQIRVIDPDGATTFSFTGSTVPLFGTPQDLLVCRCVGRFMNYMNAPRANALIRISAEVDLSKKMPKLVSGNFVPTSAMSFHTDNEGYVVMDLVRGGEFFLMVAGEDDQLWSFKVPNRPTANLIDLIQVRPTSVTYDGASVTAAVGETWAVDTTVTWSDFITRDGDVSAYVEFISSNEAVATAIFDGAGHLNVLGVGQGACTITAQAIADTFPRSVPATSLTTTALSVSVA